MQNFIVQKNSSLKNQEQHQLQQLQQLHQLQQLQQLQQNLTDKTI